MSHEAYPSAPDKNRFQQRLSIDVRLYRKIKTRKGLVVFYKALCNSDGFFRDPKHQQIMLVECQNIDQSNEDSENCCRCRVDMNKTVREIADKFNFLLEHELGVVRQTYKRSFIVEFQELQMAELESVSFFDKSRREGEYFLFSTKLSKPIVFLDSHATAAMIGQRVNGGHGTFRRKSSSRGRGDQRDGDFVLHAFVHFFFCHTNGRMIVDCLQGNHSQTEGYTLMNPVLHTVRGGCGPRDEGEDGVRRVISKHRCNDYCSHLPGMKELLKTVRTYGEVSKMIIPTMSIGPMRKPEVEMLRNVMPYEKVPNSLLPVGCAGVWGRKARYPL